MTTIRAGSHRRWLLALLLVALGSSAAPGAEAVGVGHRASGAEIPATVATTSLTFSFSSGWTTAQETPIKAFLAKAYPLMVAFYGAPSHSNAVILTADTSLHGWAFTDPPWPNPEDTIHIRINPADLTTWDRRLQLLTHEILHAFHGFDQMPTSALEEGETESAAAILRPRIAVALGVSFTVPGEPQGDPSYDGLNQNVLGGRYWYGPTVYWPQSQELYAAAAGSFWTMQLGKPTFYQDLNAAWYAHFDPTESWDLQTGWIHATLGSLAPTIGPWSYDTWRVKQSTFALSHPAGYHLSCLDQTPQAYSFASGAYHLTGEIVIIHASSVGTDAQYTGTVHVVVYRPNGTIFINTRLHAQALLTWLAGATWRYPHKLPAGAYRVVVSRVTTSGDVRIGACRFVEGYASKSRLIVIGIPGHKVTARYSYRNPTTHIVSVVTSTRTIGTTRLAIFPYAVSGPAAVAIAGQPWLRVVPLGPRGAVASVTYP